MISDLGIISHPNPQPPSEIRKTVFTQMIQYLITVLNLPNIYTWFPSWMRLSLGYHSTGPSLQLEDDAPFNMTRMSQKIRCIYEENTRKTATCYLFKFILMSQGRHHPNTHNVHKYFMSLSMIAILLTWNFSHALHTRYACSILHLLTLTHTFHIPLTNIRATEHVIYIPKDINGPPYIDI